MVVRLSMQSCIPPAWSTQSSICQEYPTLSVVLNGAQGLTMSIRTHFIIQIWIIVNPEPLYPGNNSQPALSTQMFKAGSHYLAACVYNYHYPLHHNSCSLIEYIKCCYYLCPLTIRHSLITQLLHHSYQVTLIKLMLVCIVLNYRFNSKNYNTVILICNICYSGKAVLFGCHMWCM